MSGNLRDRSLTCRLGSPGPARPFLWAVVFCAAGAACGDAPNHERAAGDPPNVVIFLIDTLRADRLGAYGYDKATSPNFDELTKTSVLFTEANAPAPWTLPSVVSLMLSSFLSEHGVVRDRDVIAPNAPTLAGRMKQLGFSTASYFENPYVGPLSGLDRGFDLCRDVDEHPGPKVVAEWLETAPDGPFFLYLHNTIPHDPYQPAPEFLAPFGEVSDLEVQKISEIQDAYRALTRGNRPGSRHGREDTSPQQTEHMRELETRRDSINALYDGEVLQVDNTIGEVVRELKEYGVWDNTVFLIVSDHGEEMGEHGGWEHDHSVYEELVRVPFLMHFPGDEFGGTRIDAPVSLIDVMPTLLDYVGAPELASECSGRSIMDLVRASSDGALPAQLEPRVTAYRFNMKKFYAPFDEQRGDENIVVRDGEWKGIWNVGRDTFELYDLKTDRGEERDLADSEPERAAALQAVALARRERDAMRRSARTDGTPVEMTDDEREKLRALGYLGEDE